jgi:hypothetical protein
MGIPMVLVNLPMLKDRMRFEQSYAKKADGRRERRMD